jgi:hypothetical protein
MDFAWIACVLVNIGQINWSQRVKVPIQIVAIAGISQSIFRGFRVKNESKRFLKVLFLLPRVHEGQVFDLSQQFLYVLVRFECFLEFK